jgi:hypothetical protein
MDDSLVEAVDQREGDACADLDEIIRLGDRQS